MAIFPHLEYGQPIEIRPDSQNQLQKSPKWLSGGISMRVHVSRCPYIDRLHATQQN